MTASFDTHYVLAGKTGAAIPAVTCAAVIDRMNAATLNALAGANAP